MRAPTPTRISAAHTSDPDRSSYTTQRYRCRHRAAPHAVDRPYGAGPTEVVVFTPPRSWTATRNHAGPAVQPGRRNPGHGELGQDGKAGGCSRPPDRHPHQPHPTGHLGRVQPRLPLHQRPEVMSAVTRTVRRRGVRPAPHRPARSTLPRPTMRRVRLGSSSPARRLPTPGEGPDHGAGGDVFHRPHDPAAHGDHQLHLGLRVRGARPVTQRQSAGGQPRRPRSPAARLTYVLFGCGLQYIEPGGRGAMSASGSGQLHATA